MPCSRNSMAPTGKCWGRTMFWGKRQKEKPAYPWKPVPSDNLQGGADPREIGGPRFAPLPTGYTQQHRREFNAGAPAFVLATHGLDERPVVAGYSPQQSFRVYMPTIDVYAQQLLLNTIRGIFPLGQPPAPRKSVYFPAEQIAQLVALNAKGIGLVG